MTDANPRHPELRSSSGPAGGLGLFQFSLRSLFVIVTVTAITLSTYFGVGRLLGMSTTEVLTQGLGRLLLALPTLLVWIVGLTMAVRFLNRNRLAATLTIIALGGLLLDLLALQVVQMALIHSIRSGRLGAGAASWNFSLMGIFRTVFNTAWWILILLAIFARRPPDPRETKRIEPSGNPFLTDEPHTFRAP
jgi:hypothetical protein